MPKKKEEEQVVKTIAKEDLSFHYFTNAMLTGLILITYFIRLSILCTAGILLRVVQDVRVEELGNDAGILTAQLLERSLVAVIFLIVSMGVTHILVKKENKKGLFISIGVLGLILLMNLIEVLYLFNIA